ncbi:MAG TPA: hypothetical protein VEU30_16310, partial [Thermoanaerobaculia bacterium]|nr:hypothetical protein [Thermoanaerobaculia bacterium]
RDAGVPLSFGRLSIPLFFALYCLEAGLFFTVVPWTRVWTLNPFLHGNVALAFWADNPFVRGFISGLGVVHLIVGMRELFRLLRNRRSPQP